jgi:hypothetical protein
LSAYPISVKLLESNSSYFKIQLKDVGSGYDIYDGIWTGWCADKGGSIQKNEWYQGHIYCSYDPPYNLLNIAWPKINWIINNKGLYSADYIQDCIWHFTNGISPNEWAEWAEFLAINFCPNVNQKYVAIIDIPGKQTTFIEVPVAQATQSNEPVIKSIDPSEPGVNQSKQWISILGENFHENSEVMFTCNGEEYLVNKERVVFISSKKIEVYIGLTECGKWSIKITNPDGKKSDEFIFHVTEYLKNIIPRALLEEIEEQAKENYNQKWKDKISESQFRAWITAIAYGEGKYGGFTAHSKGNSGEDYFEHYDLGNDFYFSTGIGPFQIDRGGEESKDSPWHKWPTKDKLDYKKTVETVAKQHYYRFNSNNYSLSDFADPNLCRTFCNSYKYNAVSGQDKAKEKWEAITGTSWDDNKDQSRDLEWEEIKERIANDDSRYSYKENINCIGEKNWEIKSSDNIKTDDEDSVQLDGYYRTWLIKVLDRDFLGKINFKYYYMFEESKKIEIWCYADDQDYTHIFVRKYDKGEIYSMTSQYPEGIGDNKYGYTLTHPVIIP